MRSRSSVFILLFLLPFCSFEQVKAQGTVEDSSLFMMMVAPSYAYHLPGGDLQKRFGNSSNIGLRAGLKLENNFQFSLLGTFIFGKNVKNTDQLLTSLKTSRGYVLDVNGDPAGVQYFERGFSISLQGGKLFPFGYNPNSGLLIRAGGGFLQHNIRYETESDQVPQLKDDRKDYFDRRASGFTFHEFVGYQHLANNGAANFFIGIEGFQAFTKNRRSYNVDDQKQNEGIRADLLYGIRAGYILAIYESESQETFYY